MNTTPERAPWPGWEPGTIRYLGHHLDHRGTDREAGPKHTNRREER